MGHIHEMYDFTTSIFVVFKNKVLLHRHKKYPLWLPPGGHIELDEDPTETAVREVQEEMGLDIELVGNTAAGIPPTEQFRELAPPKYLNRHYVGEGYHQHIDMVYFARANTDELVLEEGCGPAKWFSREELGHNVEMIKEDVRRYALLALDELSE